ncbi:hypothetical protein PHISCL_00557 [Aspergillus sclerotialis]|uniref:Uncharacterized protein n=1 Tax=Aspergillus sclerotialis TaxID=2070753 RepID=A0A3A2ZWL3_9EURO|nr:hypothetical protein PHISCL_00557 [Aspergillus sclerotialis]
MEEIAEEWAPGIFDVQFDSVCSVPHAPVGTIPPYPPLCKDAQSGTGDGAYAFPYHLMAEHHLIIRKISHIIPELSMRWYVPAKLILLNIASALGQIEKRKRLVSGCV